MTSENLILAAAAGAISLAICATLWAFAQRRRLEGVVSRLKQRLELLEKDNLSAHASAEAFDSALLAVEDGTAHLASGEDSLDACATVLGIEPGDGAPVAANAQSASFSMRWISSSDSPK